MSDTAGDVDDYDIRDALAIQTLTLLRLYDMMGAILTKMDEDFATEVLRKHAEGEFIAPPPWGGEVP